MTSQQLRESVNEKLIEAMSKNILPWRRPWSAGSSGRHRNFATNRAYSGVNPLLLEIHNLKHGLSSNRWATFRQWESIGCHVKKRPADVPAGHWGCTVVFCKPVKKAVVDKETGETDESRYFILRSFTVFSADQVTGEAVEKLKGTTMLQPVNGNAYPAVEELIAATGAEIRHGGDKAYYALPLPSDSWPNHKSGDYIVMPDRRRFVTPEAYLETCLHELAHYCEVRVGWDRSQHGYAMGELVAEISACYLASELGMPITLDQHAAYLRTWADGMKDSASFIFRACNMASKTTDFLLSFVRPEETEGSEEGDESRLVATAC
jgi:antirestriction protein ArdC